MEIKTILICLMLFSNGINISVYSQDANNRKFNPDQPIFFTPKNHDPNFSGFKKGSTKSFYQSKSEWQHIIDTTWGPGDPLERKLLIFNTYAKTIHDKFDSFNSLQVNWDSLYNHYLGQINESTSKGAFSSIMSHFAYDLKEGHTVARDTSVILTALNPGVPVLLLGYYMTYEHFGAITTILPDSTTLVLRVVPNHPLDIEPGDIILGYEGIPWKNLIRELLNAGLPMWATTGGCKTADTYNNLLGAGMNWHLFSTIDILKYSSGDTVHLSVMPMLDLNVAHMINNEQMPIRNIPFPNPILYPATSDTVVTYGILENTNIGYVFLAMEWPEGRADAQFTEAMIALKNTDALIIDMRFNFGGGDWLPNTFNLLFNESHKTLEYAFRCNKNTDELCPSTSWKENFPIVNRAPDFYDRPIAVLLGPSCISMGDITAQRLSYHPMVKFFGASPVAAYGASQYITSFPDWHLAYSVYNAYHTSEPTVYLNRKEFPIDFPVWFNKDDVAKGKDPIVEKSLEWINNLAYGHNVTTDKWWYSAGSDTVTIDAVIENPNSHDLSAKLFFESLDGSVVDSTDMAKSALTEGNQWQGKWKTPGPSDNTYWISVKVTDNTDGKYFTNKHATKITTVPILIDSMVIVRLNDTTITFKPFLKNAGTSQKITRIKVNIADNDPWIIKTSPAQIGCSDILSGLVKGTAAPFKITYDPTTAPDPLYFNLNFTVTTDGWPYWVIDTTVFINPVGIEPKESLPLAFSLDQNFPNPFNSTTTIGYGIKEKSNVKITVLNAIGKEVAIVMNAEKEAGNHKLNFNAANLPAGVYYYQVKAGEFVQTKKMILLK